MSAGIPEGCPSTEEVHDIIIKYRSNTKTPEVEELGKGSYGSVIRYKDWVIKEMKLPSDLHRTLFESEADTLAALSKIEDLRDFIPNFCWSAITETRDLGIIVQKYEPVVTLYQVIHSAGKAAAKAVYETIKNLIRGFELLHMAGYVHRDIKPGNILIRKGGGAKKYIPIIIDFGFACPMPCPDRGRKGTPGYIPMNWIAETEGKTSGKGFRRENMYLIPRRNKKGYELAYEGRIPANVTLRKKVKTQPYKMYPEYSKYSDNYALFTTLYQLYQKAEWTGHEDWRDEIIRKLQTFLSQSVSQLAAQFARNSNSMLRERRMKAIANLNSRRAARMENRATENANAALLANFAAAATAPANNTTRRSKRPRTGPGPNWL